MQKIFIIGNLARDPDPIRAVNTRNGRSTDVCSFTVAVRRKNATRESDQTADFFRVSVWGGLAQTCHDSLAKGKKVSVIGELNVSTYDKNGKTYVQLNINADEVEFLSPKGDPIASEPTELDKMANIPESDIPF